VRIADPVHPVKRIPSRIVRSMFLRSFAIQGSWNYRTLQGSGFAFALMPMLRWLHHEDAARLQDAVTRHTSLFNAHPYLAGVALGAVARMELDGEDPALIERFKTALRGSLGTLGDRIVWAGWRPACVLLGLVVLLVTGSAMAAMLVFLIVYNAGHLALRWWALQIGVAHGREVGERLRRAPLSRWHELVTGAGALLLGMTLTFVATGALTGSRLPLVPITLAALAVFAGWRLGIVVRLPALILLVVVAIAGFLYRIAQ
jgi:PTS system mannose-specific IID component